VIRDPKPAAARGRTTPWVRMGLIAAAVVAVGYGGFLAWRAYAKPAAPALGTL
jgi:hypothetical protein